MDNPEKLATLGTKDKQHKKHNTEKEQVIIKKTCNNEQIEFLCA